MEVLKGADLTPSEPTLKNNIENHPCFSGGCHAKNARIHLAVAPACNISCNFCSRKFDCANESRPGVTSAVLTPEDALERYQAAKERLSNLTVAGIAGPGDPLANWKRVKKTFELIRSSDPNVALCLSTNGLLLPERVDDLVELGLSHLTVTVNAVDPEIGAKVYGSILYQGKRYEGIKAATILINNQLEGIRLSAQAGLKVKVNTVLIDGVNVNHAAQIAKTVRSLGAAFHNANSLIPVAGTPFEHVSPLDGETVARIRTECERYLPQIRHCRQCRADAVGLLGEDIAEKIDAYMRNRRNVKRIAVASRTGEEVDLHFGHAELFWIYDVNGTEISLVEKRRVRPFCQGPATCSEYTAENGKRDALDAMKDCHAVICLMAGPEPRAQLKSRNVRTFDASGPPESELQKACLGGDAELALHLAWDELVTNVPLPKEIVA